MATIRTRAGKGAPLLNAEIDANFENLNQEVGQALQAAQAAQQAADEAQATADSALVFSTSTFEI